jgi:hypothetical protein
MRYTRGRVGIFDCFHLDQSGEDRHHRLQLPVQSIRAQVQKVKVHPHPLRHTQTRLLLLLLNPLAMEAASCTTAMMGAFKVTIVEMAL